METQQQQLSGGRISLYGLQMNTVIFQLQNLLAWMRCMRESARDGLTIIHILNTLIRTT